MRFATRFRRNNKLDKYEYNIPILYTLAERILWRVLKITTYAPTHLRTYAAYYRVAYGDKFAFRARQINIKKGKYIHLLNFIDTSRRTFSRAKTPHGGGVTGANIGAICTYTRARRDDKGVFERREDAFFVELLLKYVLYFIYSYPLTA